MSRRWSICIAGAIAAISATAHADDDDDVSNVELPDWVVPREPEMVPFSRFEVWGWLAAQTDWLSYQIPHPTFGGGAELVANLDDRRRARVGAFAYVTSGPWGTANYGSPNLSAGLSLRLTPALVQDQLLDGHMVLRPAWVTDGEHHGLRASTGIGLRIGRAFAAELTYDPVFGLDQRFEERGTESRVAHGVGAQMGFNFCVLGCQGSEPAEYIVDCDRDFFSLADRLAVKLARDPSKHGAVCEGVRAALNSYDNPGAATDDPTTRYLLRLTALLVARGVDTGEIDQLRELHEKQVQKSTGANQESRYYQRADHQVKRIVSYAPTPIELAARLLCTDAVPRPTRPMFGEVSCADVEVNQDLVDVVTREDRSRQVPAR